YLQLQPECEFQRKEVTNRARRFVMAGLAAFAKASACRANSWPRRSLGGDGSRPSTSLAAARKKGVDARVKPGHDAVGEWKGVIRGLAMEAMADYACTNPPDWLKMCPTMTLEIPPAVATEAFTDAKAAVDRLEEIYERNTKFLRDRFEAY